MTKFYPERAGSFPCPICLDWLSDDAPERISLAHVVPRAAGGRLKTILCTSCNSTLGSRSDSWLGEFLRADRVEGPAVLNSITQAGFFTVAGERVAGEVQVDAAGAHHFQIIEDRVSPKSLAAVTAGIARTRVQLSPRFVSRGEPLRIELPSPPLIERSNEVAIGLLTAGYLLWFRALGYSWALQAHLDAIRCQIRQGAAAGRNVCFGLLDERVDEPFVGVGTINGEAVLLARFERAVVVFPTAGGPHLLDRLPRGLLNGQAHFEDVHSLAFGRDRWHGPPVAVAFHNRLLVFPDVCRDGQCPLLWFSEGRDAAQLLMPEKTEPATRLKPRHQGIDITAKTELRLSAQDTGRERRSGE